MSLQKYCREPYNFLMPLLKVTLQEIDWKQKPNFQKNLNKQF